MVNHKNKQGAVTLAAVTVVLFSLLALVVALSFAGLGELLSGRQTATSNRALFLADSCLHEALLRLKRDPAYSGGVLSAGSDSCTISVSGSGSTRTIAVSAASGQTIRSIAAGVALQNGVVSLSGWSEKTD